MSRWRAALEHALEKDANTATFQLATLDAGQPRVRSLIHRQFLSPKHNPSVFLLLATTDVRTPKTTQIVAHPHIESVFWSSATQEQFRITGQASIVPSPADPSYAHFDPVRGPVLRALRAEGFDWEQKRVELFNAMSAHMRASWCRPVPGSKMGSYDEAKAWPEKLPRLGDEGDEKERALVRMSFANFALVLVDPGEVDYVELGVVPNQRTVFRRGDDGEEWREEIVVP